MLDLRIQKLAKLLVNYSVKVKKGENVLIEAGGIDYQLINELIKEVAAKGGFPFVNVTIPRVQREILKCTSLQHCQTWAEFDKFRMSKMQCYIGIRGGDNSFENCDVPEKNMQLYSKEYAKPVHHDLRVAKTKWVILRYPTGAFAQSNNLSTEAFEDYFFDVCTLDYAKMDKAMNALQKVMKKTDKVRIVGKNTDLTFSIKGIPSKKCSGGCNIPDGEVYTAPVKDSVNGIITYNVPSIQSGFKFENVSLTFEKGKIVKATANDNKRINAILDTDEGARYIGEFAFGVNPFITRASGDILFDEKISGSVHFTPGSCYEECSNGNDSSIHWDLVLVQTKEMGGGEIYFDDVLIRKDGLFVLEELKCLNPQNLK